MVYRCSTCTGDFLPIAGSGPRKSDILFIGERPSQRSSEMGQILAGPVGEEFDETYLYRAGLQREEVRVENCVRCAAANNRTPSDNEVEACSRYFLPMVLKECKPDVLVLMGGRACHILDQKIKIDNAHGRPFYGSVLDGVWEGLVFPVNHPAAGLHDGAAMSRLLEDFTNLGRWLKGDWQPPTPDETAKDYQLIETPNDFYQYLPTEIDWLLSHAPPFDVGVDTENHGPKPFSVQFSWKPHTGRMILAENKPVIRLFSEWVRDQMALLHNAPHDLDVSDKMGIRYGEVRDTMQEAFHQCSIPQGLKGLALQLLGATMRTWEDVVRPASVRAVVEWMESAYSYAEAHLATRTEVEMKTRYCPVCDKGARLEVCAKCKGPTIPKTKVELSRSAVELGMAHYIKYTVGSEEYDPWEKLAGFWVEGLRGKVPTAKERSALYDAIGPPPILGIGNCELDEAVQYGCSDADHTLQVGMELERRRSDRRWEIAEGDEDQ